MKLLVWFNVYIFSPTLFPHAAPHCERTSRYAVVNRADIHESGVAFCHLTLKVFAAPEDAMAYCREQLAAEPGADEADSQTG
jgi:hypothetical protein